MNEQSAASLRGAKRKASYKLQFGRTDANKKRRVARHVKGHPLDVAAATYYEKTRGFGPVKALRWTAKGFKRQARAMEAANRKQGVAP